MANWSELENQFKELAPYFQYSRIDVQWGDSGEHFRIAGGVDRRYLERFEIIAENAGKKLDKSMFNQEYPEVFNETDPLKRWYKALWKIGNNLEFNFPGYMLNDQEEVIGTIYAGTISHIIDVSALMCYKLSSMNDHQNKNSDITVERSPFTLDKLHYRVINVSQNLYLDGYYRSAVLDAYIDLINRIKEISNITEIDGINLMQKVFSAKNPIIQLSEDQDEQLGFMWLFTGAVMAIRNPKAHKVTDITDPQRTLEWLGFASVLHRILDDAEILK